MKFSEAIDSFMLYQQVMTSKGNYSYLKDKVRIIREKIGSHNVETINRNTLLIFIQERRDNNPDITNSTINKYLEIIKRILKTEANIVLIFQKLKEVKKTIEIVPKEVVEDIFEHYQKNLNNKNNLRNYILFRILLETGLRINELLHIKVHDIDFKLNTIHVRVTKTKTERFVFFEDETKRLMELYMFKYLIQGYFFKNQYGAKLEYRPVEKVILRLKKRLYIAHSISPHKWRHTFATNYIEHGGDTATLQRILGHNNLSTTEKYLHLNVDILRKRYEEFITNKNNEKKKKTTNK